MWELGQKAEKASKLPSECVPGLRAEIGEWGVYCFDNALGFFVRTIENALHERVETGTARAPQSEARYTLGQLLEDDFRLPRPLTYQQQRRAVGAQVKALFGLGAPQRGKRRGKPQTGGGSLDAAPSGLVAHWLAHKGNRAPS